ncbi:uncharacterized protein SPSK_10596 [Sporothrix schenckii 1099-18]|uniref:Uncharacterized protein n=1 Tax=Sporothrix schenckii 1099-18 TaxID=1397361 RepID=A0A0F2M413_SPOSC|nr:uncharacterized protein SPSK_10596 [Sporothrix schenckii 1099-18]KJR82911.1 hypothetical protein SPSK_10596 [Sporothrix schenckii 1099-18]
MARKHQNKKKDRWNKAATTTRTAVRNNGKSDGRERRRERLCRRKEQTKVRKTGRNGQELVGRYRINYGQARSASKKSTRIAKEGGKVRRRGDAQDHTKGRKREGEVTYS